MDVPTNTEIVLQVSESLRAESLNEDNFVLLYRGTPFPALLSGSADMRIIRIRADLPPDSHMDILVGEGADARVAEAWKQSHAGYGSE